MFDNWLTSVALICGEDAFDPSQWQPLYTDNWYQYIFNDNEPISLSDEWTSSDSLTNHQKQQQCLDCLHSIPSGHLQRETPGETTKGETTKPSLGDPPLSPPSLEPPEYDQDLIPPSQEDNSETIDTDPPPPAVSPH